MRTLLLIAVFCLTQIGLASGAAPFLDDPVSNRLREDIAARLSLDPSKIEILQLVPMHGNAKLFPGQVLQIRPSNPRRLIGRAVFVLSIQGPDGQNRMQWVSAEVVRLQDIVVTKSALKRHELIGAEDLEIKEIRLRGSRQRFETDPQVLIGKRTMRSLKKGAAIRMDWVEDAPLILRGDRITLLLETVGLKISTLGKAVEDGLHGEQIKVVNLDSKKIVVGQVIGQGRVRVGDRPQ